MEIFRKFFIFTAALHVMALLKDIRHIVLYGLILAILIFTLKWLQWKFVIVEHAESIYMMLIAAFFSALGIWVAKQLVKPKRRTLVVEKEIVIPKTGAINETELQKLGLSSREYEVLQLLAKGHSNAEIAENLFLSVSTVKTHVSTLFLKIGVKSRTQAIQKSKRLKIIA